MAKRNYVEEILQKKKRNHKRGGRKDIFLRRVHPLVKGFSEVRALDKSVSWRNEWLKYSAIGYVACVEGYIRLLIADVINQGQPYLDRVSNFKEIKFTAEIIVAFQKNEITLGDYISHLLPINNLSDINSHLSILLDADYIKFYKQQPLSDGDSRLIGDVFENELGELERLFKLRHMHAHELATKERFPVGKIEELVGAAAVFVIFTDEIFDRILANAPNK